MFINIDGKAVAIGVVFVLVALGLLFPSRATELLNTVRFGLIRLLLTPGTIVGVSV